MAPDARKTLEIGGAVLAALRVVPETDRHDREGAGAHQLAFFLPHGLAVFSEYIDRHAQAAALDFATMHRQQGIAEHEAGNDVGAAGNRGEQ